MAERLARTETAKGYSEGNLEAYRQLDIQMKKWITAGDDLVDEDCLANEADGEIPIEATFTSGDSAAPVHPNCRCDVLPVVIGDIKTAIDIKKQAQILNKYEEDVKKNEEKMKQLCETTIQQSERIIQEAKDTARSIVETAAKQVLSEKKEILSELSDLKEKANAMIYG